MRSLYRISCFYFFITTKVPSKWPAVVWPDGEVNTIPSVGQGVMGTRILHRCSPSGGMRDGGGLVKIPAWPKRGAHQWNISDTENAFEYHKNITYPPWGSFSKKFFSPLSLSVCVHVCEMSFQMHGMDLLL